MYRYQQKRLYSGIRTGAREAFIREVNNEADQHRFPNQAFVFIQDNGGRNFTVYTPMLSEERAAYYLAYKQLRPRRGLNSPVFRRYCPRTVANLVKECIVEFINHDYYGSEPYDEAVNHSHFSYHARYVGKLILK